MKFRFIFNISAAIIVTTMIISHVCMVNAQGNSTDASRAYKIGIIDVQNIMDNYDKQKTRFAELQEEAKKTRDKLDAREKAFNDDLKKLRDDKDTISEDVYIQRSDELINRKTLLDSDMQREQTSLNRKHERLKQELLKDIVTAVGEVGTAEDYHLILESDPETRTGVLYHSSTMNMTQKIIDKLNAK